MLLKAHFNIRLPGNLWLSSSPGPAEEKLVHVFVDQTADTSVRVTFDLKGVWAQVQNQVATWPINEVKVEAECESYGESKPDWTDFTTAFHDVSFISGFLGLVGRVGEVVQGLLTCFKYQHRHASLGWLDPLEVLRGLNRLEVDGSLVNVPELRDDRLLPDRSQFLTPVPIDSLTELVWTPVEADERPNLTNEILVDACAALEDHNVRRSVIETAVTCEVAVKSKLYGPMADYMDQRGRLRARVLELIDWATKDVHGRSFKDEHEAEFLRIDYLFRSRNQAAHRGVLTYRNNQGDWKVVTERDAKAWIAAVDCLLGWLESLPD